MQGSLRGQGRWPCSRVRRGPGPRNTRTPSTCSRLFPPSRRNDRSTDRPAAAQRCRRRRRDTQARRVLGAPQSRTASAGDEASRRPTPVRARRAPPLFLAPVWALGASLMQGSAGRGAGRGAGPRPACLLSVCINPRLVMRRTARLPPGHLQCGRRPAQRTRADSQRRRTGAWCSGEGRPQRWPAHRLHNPTALSQETGDSHTGDSHAGASVQRGAGQSLQCARPVLHPTPGVPDPLPGLRGCTGHQAARPPELAADRDTRAWSRSRRAETEAGGVREHDKLRPPETRPAAPSFPVDVSV